MRATLGDRPPLPGAAGGGVVSTPGLGIGRPGGQSAAGGMAGRRMKPGLKLSQMTGLSPSPNTGLGPGRPVSPTNGNPPPRKNQGEFGTPFSSFSKIV